MKNQNYITTTITISREALKKIDGLLENTGISRSEGINTLIMNAKKITGKTTSEKMKEYHRKLHLPE